MVRIIERLPLNCEVSKLGLAEALLFKLNRTFPLYVLLEAPASAS